MYTRRNQRHPKLNFMIDSRRFLHLWRNSSPSGIESHLEGQNYSLQSDLDFKLDAHISWLQYHLERLPESSFVRDPGNLSY